MYEETYEGGREFIRVLNEVIGDFDGKNKNKLEKNYFFPQKRITRPF